MIELQPEGVEELAERFYHFYDGVVSAVELRLRQSPTSCLVAIHAQDRDSAGRWSEVVFEIQELREFRFEAGKTTFEVLSSGLQFSWREGLVYLVLDAYPDEPGDLPDLKKNTAFIAGRVCSWTARQIEVED